MSCFFEGFDLNPVGGDNVPIIPISNIIENKASMMLYDLLSSNGIGRYMKQSIEDSCLPCHVPKKKDGKLGPFNSFTVANGAKLLVYFDEAWGPIDSNPRTPPSWNTRKRFISPENVGCYMSLFELLQSCPDKVDYHGLEETMKYFRQPCNIFGPFHVGDRFVLRRFPELRPCEKQEGCSLEQSFQNDIGSFLVRGFPDPGNTLCDAPETRYLLGAIDFNDERGICILRSVYHYFLIDATLAKGVVPVTHWFVRNGELKKASSCIVPYMIDGYPMEPTYATNHLVPVGLPGKQPLLHLDSIAETETVVICSTPRNAVALQKANGKKPVVFTGFICDPGQYSEVDWAPLKGKSVVIEVANHSGLTLAEAYTEAFSLYEYLRDTVKVEDFHFLQRAIAYPSTEGVRNVDDLVDATRKNPPHVIDGSILELNEDEFPAMVERAQAEIARKATAMNDVAFWNEELQVEACPVETDKPAGKITDKMILRPFFIAGTTTLITGAPGVGKSCIKTAICAYIAGSPRKILEGKFWTRCTPADGHQYKVVDLIFDSDGAEAIADHRRDFASDVGANDANYIQKDMSGDPINYLKPENYPTFEKLLDDIEAHEGVPGQSIDVLMLDTLFALSHEANTLHHVNEFIKSLNHNRPCMAVGLLHHLNTKEKAFGGVRVLTGVRAHISLFRTDEQMKELNGKHPLLSDPFTMSIEKASNNKIAEDGESFAVRLEDGNVFALVDKEDKETIRCRRKAIIEGYAKQGLTQPEIARLFGVDERTIRNWISKTE